MKKKWEEKLYKHFIGAIDERDEYQKQEINKELAFSGMILWYLNMIAMFIMLIVDTINNTMSIGTIITFIINMIYAGYLIRNIEKKKLNDTECTTKEEYLEKKKKLKKQSLKAGIYFSFQMFILMCYIFPYLSSGTISISLFDIIIWSGGGIFFGVSIYLVALSNLKKLY
ncbi:MULTISPECIES: DUF3278 domain-containing protein [unclassified Bacillus cereus group]|uniref:DUF3278 domain-containing protein n=1 Tax=unclassified Bacillus cereus group TaxID=2750818 RepID=UPI001F59FD0B|nr:DUF3278 domain-containing protein [Bacillus cereus group sp. BfR-BA-01423]